jgi:superfamily I DNA/RNA helicase
MTIHAAKGLEFNTVFIPGCEDGIIPFQLFGKKNAAGNDEEERLFYVGVTRTRQRLYLSHSEKRSYRGRVLGNRRSPFIDRLEQSLLEISRREQKAPASTDEIQLNLFG